MAIQKTASNIRFNTILFFEKLLWEKSLEKSKKSNKLIS